MSRIAFTDEISAPGRGDIIPKFKLEVGEKARVALLEGPEQVYVHQLYEPVIVNGRGVKENKERRDGTTIEVYKESFVKSFQCLGSEETLFQSGVDIKNCPSCKAAFEHDSFRNAQPRYAINVVRYNTKAGTNEVSTPFSVKVEPWVFGPQKFEQIRALAKEGYDLKAHDLLLGPCQHKDFQKYDIMVSPKAEWQASEETKKITLETFKSNRIKDEDLSKIIAQQLSIDMVDSYVQRVKQKWAVINGEAVSTTDAILAAADLGDSAPKVDFNTGMPSTDAPAEDTSNFDELLSGLL